MSPSPLISAAELHDLFEMGRGPVVLDIRFVLQTGSDRAGYEAGHIPNAQFVDLDAELAAPPDHGSGASRNDPNHRGRHPLPDAETFVAAMRGPVPTYCVGPVTAAPLELLGVPTIQPERSRLGSLARLIIDDLPTRRHRPE